MILEEDVLSSLQAGRATSGGVSGVPAQPEQQNILCKNIFII